MREGGVPVDTHRKKNGKRAYSSPVMTSQKMELGVFGDYGPNIGVVDPKPIKKLRPLGLNME